MNHVSLGFAKLKDPDLLAFGESVSSALTVNAAALTGCPVTPATLDAANQDFSAKLAATAQGGTTATAAKNASRAALVATLRQIAAWLEGKAAGSVDLITLAGFEVTMRGHTAQTVLATPAILAILNVMTTQLQLRVSSVPNARAYEVQYRVGAGAWTAGGSYPSARAIAVPNLVPGTLYEFRVRVIGGSTGWSDWSDASSHMCM